MVRNIYVDTVFVACTLWTYKQLGLYVRWHPIKDGNDPFRYRGYKNNDTQVFVLMCIYEQQIY